jgi:hypothetical protein
VERLSHPHEDKVTQPIATRSERAVYVQDLAHDLTGAQMPGETHLTSGTEHTPHRAAGLCADTGGHTAGITHRYSFDLLAVIEPEEILHGSAVGTPRGCELNKVTVGTDSFTPYLRVDPTLEGRRESA